MQTLSRREDEQLFKQVKADALKYCDPVVKEFAACAEGRTLSVAWKCRTQLSVMQECIKSQMSEEILDKARIAALQARPTTS